MIVEEENTKKAPRRRRLAHNINKWPPTSSLVASL